MAGPYNEAAAAGPSGAGQGRLNHVPSALIPPKVTGLIFDQAQEESLVLKLGRQIPVQFGQTVIPVTIKRPEAGQVGGGDTNVEREGALKPVSGTAWSTTTMSPIKIATIVTASEEFARMDPAGLATQLRSDLSYAIARAIDSAVFHKVQPINGNAVVTNSAALDSTPLAVQLNAGQLYQGLLSGYDSVNNYNYEFNGWAFDTRFRSQMLREQIPTSNYGVVGQAGPSAGNLSVAGNNVLDLSTTTANVLGLPAHFGRGVRGDLGAAADTGIVGFGGDFNQLAYGFADQISLKVSTEASIFDGTNTINLWQTNQIAILVECTFGWVLGNPNAFVKFYNGGNSSLHTTTLTPSGTAASGSYTLLVNGEPTAPLAYNATASNIQAAVVAADQTGKLTTSNVTVSGPITGGAITVAAPARVGVVSSSLLTSGSAAVTIAVS